LSFFYQRGRVKTTARWTKPTHDKALAYFRYIKDNSTILDRYDAYVVGAFLYGIEDTWDVDINLTGCYEPQGLEDDLDYLLDVSLNKFNLLVDVKWVSMMFPPFEYANFFDESEVRPVHAIFTFNIFKGSNGNVRPLDAKLLTPPDKLSENMQRTMYFYYQKKKLLDLVMSNPDKAVPQSKRILDYLKEHSENRLQNVEAGDS